MTLMVGIGVILLGYGLYEPASYSIVRRVTTPKTSATRAIWRGGTPP